MLCEATRLSTRMTGFSGILQGMHQSTDTSIGPLSGPKAGQIALVPTIAGRDRADRLYESLYVDINDE